MKRAILAAAILFAAMPAARADIDNYRDLIRPNGHARSDAVFNAAIEFCYAQTGANRNRLDTPAFKTCMRGRGYRWLSGRSTPQPSIEFDPPPVNFDVPPPPALSPNNPACPDSVC